MTHSSPVSRDSSFRHFVHSVESWLALSIILGGAGAIAAFFGAALLLYNSGALEAIREEIGAQQVILMGESWGVTLVAI